MTAEQELYDLLKSAEEVETDVDKTTVGTNPHPYPEPDGRESDSIDAPWGEDNGGPLHFSNVAVEQMLESRQRILDRYFDSKSTADDNAQKVIGTLFATKSYESSAPNLETLSDQLKRKL